MHSNKSLALVVVPLMLALLSCRSTNSEAPPPVHEAVRPPAATEAPAAAELSAREAARAVSHLRAVIAMDRQAVELAEQRLSQVRGLFDAGRVSSPDLQATEQELLELRERLQRHEQELADGQQAAAADGASRRG